MKTDLNFEDKLIKAYVWFEEKIIFTLIGTIFFITPFIIGCYISNEYFSKDYLPRADGLITWPFILLIYGACYRTYKVLQRDIEKQFANKLVRMGKLRIDWELE
jgi:hypothetical protein